MVSVAKGPQTTHRPESAVESDEIFYDNESEFV